MADAVTLEQVEALAAQLPPAQRLKLAAHICEELSGAAPPAGRAVGAELQRQRQKEADELLALLDAAAEMSPGESDATEDIRRMRAERDEQIWPSR